MTQILWDASGLIKRYAQEIGSDAVDAVFDIQSPLPMVVTYLGYAETNASLRRKLNRGNINHAAYQIARSAVRSDIQAHPGFHTLSILDADILAGMSLTDQHNLNSSDASILSAYLRFAQSVDDTCVLVAADARLLRAAATEGLKTLNPELLPAEDVSVFLGTLQTSRET